MKLYRYLTGPDDANFCLRVSEALNNGWELHGGPTLAFDGQRIIAGQAVVKEAPGQFSRDIDLSQF
ncbi:MAG: DUF1737 domain-containing protein [Humidesulfovibrio sp.]|uniref:DUF1737 domain-containing protein n=1 Tax=Humidesulfovibrio sp. TaxID=2910988 RepID=UPI002736F095|nr:DUF1737 domain-containing protein [Humidesulfovibrio sp.]MDP2847006.1 DUF1737 domain-containing protein [Humidesulfovibrio sp.]